MLIILALCGCNSARFVVPIHKDTTSEQKTATDHSEIHSSSNTRRDSTHVSDRTIYRYVGDTVFVDREIITFRDREIHDSIFVYLKDSTNNSKSDSTYNEVPVPVKVPPSKLEVFKASVKLSLIWLVLIAAMVFCIKIYRKTH